MYSIAQSIDTDVLVMGGGIAGLMAAIASADRGAKVIVAEKANTRRSGSGATGNDHFRCWIPEKHGPDYRVIMNEVLNFSQFGLCHDTVLTRHFLEKSFDIVKMWDAWGIPMRPTGDWEFTGHAFPGRIRSALKYDGAQQKPILTREARKRGAGILNHHAVIELLAEDGEIAGALTLDTSRDEPAFTLIRAKCVVVATGCTTRLYVNKATPGWMFNTAFCPGNAGGGIAQSFRAGAKLVNLELATRHAGPRYFERAGKSTWIGVYKYPDGRTLGPFVSKPTKELGDITSDIWNASFTEVVKNGSGPAYLDCSETSPEDLAYMRWGMKGEGLTALLDYMDREGIDPARHAVEFMQYEPFLIGKGLDVDINGQCSLPGRYAAGDVVGNFRADNGGAAVYGWISGDHAGTSAAGRTLRGSLERHPAVERTLALCADIMKRGERGYAWDEANMAVQQLMSDYAPAGPFEKRSESLLDAGLHYMRALRGKSRAGLGAVCSHTLLRALESLDLMDVGEALMVAARERRESRGPHLRADYTFTNPMLGELFLDVFLREGEIQTEWRKRNMV